MFFLGIYPNPMVDAATQAAKALNL